MALLRDGPQRVVRFLSIVVFTSLVALGCGSGEEVGEPADLTATTAPNPSPTGATVAETTATTEPPTASSTVTSTTSEGGPVLRWGPPIRVEDPQPDPDGILGLGMSFRSPVAGSASGIVLVGTTPQGEGFEAATRVWFSADGSTWEPVELINGVRLRSVAAVGTGFVAVGGEDTDEPAPATPAGVIPQPAPAAWTSTDGLGWEPATGVDRGAFAFGAMADVVATDVGLVAVGQVWDRSGEIHPAVWSSPDGLIWTMVPGDPLGTTEDRMSLQVAGGRGGFVVIGQTIPAEGGGPGPVSAWWSPDGIRWDRAADTDPFGVDLALGELVSFGPGFVVGGSRGARDPLVWSSPDGRSWDAPVRLPTRPETGSTFVRGLATDGSTLVAVGDDVVFAEGTGPAIGDASIWQSSDAVDWAQVPPEELRGDAVLDGVDATSVLRFGDGWVVLGTTSDHAEERVAGVVWFSS